LTKTALFKSCIVIGFEMWVRCLGVFQLDFPLLSWLTLF